MAIDTNLDLVSLIGMGKPFFIVGPLVEGAFDQDEKQHLLHLYAGIAAETPSVAPLAFERREVVRFTVGDPL